MTNKEIAMEYLRCFCEGDIPGIEALLSNDLKFSGTFHSFNSAKEYINSLIKNPPEKSSYKILSITKNEDSVVIFYEYQKPQITLQIAQLFKFKQEKNFRDTINF